ncbi:Crp/Fnr family transcriptional regulator [Sphingomonas oryzagri]
MTGTFPTAGPAAFRISTGRYASFVSQSRLATSDLSSEERGAIEMAASATRPAVAGMEIVQEGRSDGDLHVLVAGWGYRYKTTGNGHRLVSALLLPGDVCNLDRLLLDHADYGVRMVTDGTIFSLSRARADALTQRYPGIARAFTRLALIENAVLRQWAHNLGRRAAANHLAHLFCELDARLRRHGDDGPFEMPLGRELLADVLCTSPMHVSRAMQQFRSDALVENRRGMVVPIGIARLREICKFDPAYLHEDDG